MTKATSPIPAGYHSITPYLIVDGGVKALDWYQRVFGSEERMRMPGPGGKIGHAEITIGGSTIMLADEHPEVGARSPSSIGGSPVSLMLYVKDCDAVFARAIEAGAKVDQPLEDKFYGDRTGSIVDPFGHKWTIGTHIEDLTPEEMGRRAEEASKQQH